MQFWSRFFNQKKKTKDPFFSALRLILNFEPKDPLLYQLAFRHSSHSAFKPGKKTPHNNQRLEFLGDAVLGAVVSDYLYRLYPDQDEGYLTSMRSKIVSRNNLNTIARHLGIEELVTCKMKKKSAKSIGGDTLEALIGAVYLDKGMNHASEFIKNRVLAGDVISVTQLEEHVISYKSKIIEWAQKERKDYSFNVIEQWGQQHKMNFKIGLLLNEELIETGIGSSKKLAEEDASKRAFEKLALQHG